MSTIETICYFVTAALISVWLGIQAFRYLSK